MTQNRFAAFVLLALILALALRLPHIEGDPPAGDISRSASFLADEGIHGYNALHWAITGDWYIADGFNPGVNTPVFMLFEYALLRTFGVHLKTVRYGAVACGLLSLVLLARLLRRLSRRAALMGGFLWAMAFPLVIYNRLAFIENVLLVFMLLLALLFVAFLERPQRLWPAVAGVAVFMAGWLTKPTLIFLLPAFGATLLYVRPTHHRRATGLALLTAIVLVAALYFFWVRPYADDWAYYQSIHMAERMPQSLGEILLNYARYFGHLKLFEFMPLIYGLALVQFLSGPRLSETRRAASGSGAAGVLACVWRRFSRLFRLFATALFIAAAAGGDRSRRDGVGPVAGRRSAGSSYRLDESRVYRSGFAASGVWPVPLFCAGTGLSQHGAASARPADPAALGSPRRPLAICVAGADRAGAVGADGSVLCQHGIQSARWHAESGEIHSRAGQGAGLGARRGQRHIRGARAVDCVMYREDRLPVLFRRWRSDFLLLEDPAELPRLQRLMPEYLRRLQPLAQFPLMNNYVHGRDAVLYRILPPKQD
ncbi:MAG: glycosyltransferase family 39 protein [candidate division KSB1 bacterium]|nr:glycosyltransferase family 39 protein [candidate division KSB1 bacterium]